MRLKWLTTALALITFSVAEPVQRQCQCGLFLLTSEEWKPDYMAFRTGQTYDVNCTNLTEANEDCRMYCEGEVMALNDVFANQPHILDEYLPSQKLPCDVLPAHTASFYAACGSQEWQPSTPKVSSSVCCHPSSLTPVWCDSLPGNSLTEGHEEGRAAGETVMNERKINTNSDKNAIENNEIEGSSGPSSDESGESWLTSIMSFFGYNSIGEMIQNIDIFSIPGRIQSAMKTYNDEISMGQCYMELTTYFVFKQDGVLANLLRTRRDSEVIVETDASEGKSSGSQRQIDPIQNFIGGLIGMLEGSPSTRQYADLIKQLMPFVMSIYQSDDPSNAISSLFTQAVGPLLSQTQTAGAPNPNDIHSDGSNNWPNLRRTTPAPKTTPRPQYQPTAGSSGSSPITSMILQLVKYYLSSPGEVSIAETRPTPPTTRPPVTKRPRPPPSSSASSSVINSFLGLLLGGGQPQTQVRPRPKPPVKKTPKPQIVEKHDTKSVVEMILEFIRPVFISIVGKAPGENGVASIREVTRLSSLGRVDDTLVEEVLSPYFCMKNYVVNKAWTLTERGIDSVVSRFTPEEKERMMRMLQED